MPVLDWSWARPDPAAMVAAGYEAVIRYVSYDDSKDLLADERDRILNAGMDLGLVFEATAAGPLSGRSTGERDGARMFARMQALGCPPGMAAYWAMDTNVSPGDWPALDAYGAAFLEQLRGVYPAGHYGESDVIDHLMDIGLIAYGWFAGATSWSNGRITDRAHLIQRVGGAPAGTDRNDVQRTPWGSWLQAAAGLHTDGAGVPLAPASDQSEEDTLSAAEADRIITELGQKLGDVRDQLAGYLTGKIGDSRDQLAEWTRGLSQQEQAAISALRSGDPAQVASVVPAELAKAVADELTKRLAA